ncbi:MAG: hypothetical protein AB7G06_06655 [Bdellovibrionales bacterium]
MSGDKKTFTGPWNSAQKSAPQDEKDILSDLWHNLVDNSEKTFAITEQFRRAGLALLWRPVDKASSKAIFRNREILKHAYRGMRFAGTPLFLACGLTGALLYKVTSAATGRKDIATAVGLGTNIAGYFAAMLAILPAVVPGAVAAISTLKGCAVSLGAGFGAAQKFNSRGSSVLRQKLHNNISFACEAYKNGTFIREQADEAGLDSRSIVASLAGATTAATYGLAKGVVESLFKRNAKYIKLSVSNAYKNVAYAIDPGQDEHARINKKDTPSLYWVGKVIGAVAYAPGFVIGAGIGFAGKKAAFVRNVLEASNDGKFRPLKEFAKMYRKIRAGQNPLVRGVAPAAALP